MKITSAGLLSVVLFAICFSCNNPVKLPEGQTHRFDAEQYFNFEVALLNGKSAGIIKEIVKNNLTETIVVEKADWKKELQPFFQISLNKPAQVNSFKVDTLISGDHKSVIYSAKEPSEELRKLSIYFTGTTVDSLVAISSTSNIYYHSADTISYLGNGNYKINTRNKPRIGKEISFVLAGTSVFKTNQN